MTNRKQLSFSIDRGGTFTDVYCVVDDRDANHTTTKVMKLLSEDPENYADAPREGIRRFLEAELGVSLPRSEKIPTSNISSIRMGTTVATNALLERQGERTALVVTKVWFYILSENTRYTSFHVCIHSPDDPRTTYRRITDDLPRIYR